MSFTDKEISDRIESNTKLVNKIQEKMDLLKKHGAKQCDIHGVCAQHGHLLFTER